MSLDKLLISTTLGDALVRGSDRVYIKIHSNQFIRKQARDVEEGESALWHKNKTGTRFRDIEPFLIYSPRYKSSLDFIMEQNEQGEYVNRLRALLIRGIAKRGIVSSENLEDRILNNYGGGDRPMDFTHWEIDAMTKYLVDFMRGQRDPISLWQAKNWIRGKTVAPFNWDHFDTLGKLNPEFKKWKKHKQKRDSTYFNYRLYVVVRQQIERKLLEYIGKQWGGSGEEHETFITVNPEYRLIINHFLDEHTDVLRDPDDFRDELVFARVNKKTKVRKPRQEAAIRESDKLLTDGLHVKRHPLLDTTAMSYQEVVEHKRVIDGLFKRIMEQTFLLGYRKTGREISDIINIDVYLRREYVLNRVKLEYGTHSPNSSLYQYLLENMVANKSMDDVDEFYSRFKELFIKDGSVDRFVSANHGTAMRIVEIAFKLDSALPIEVKQYLVESDRVRRRIFSKEWDLENLKKEYRERLKNLDRARRRILSRFDLDVGYRGSLDSKIFFSDIVIDLITWKGSSNVVVQKASEQGLSINEYLDSIADDTEALKEFYSQETPHSPDTLIFTRNEILDIFHKYQLSDLIGGIEEDFHYQRFVENGELVRQQWGNLNQDSGLREYESFMRSNFG